MMFGNNPFEQKAPRLHAPAIGLHAQSALAQDALARISGDAEPSEVDDSHQRISSKLDPRVFRHSELDETVTLHFDLPLRTPNDPFQLQSERSSLQNSAQMLNGTYLLREVTLKVVDCEQAIKNAGAVALLREWLRESDLGVDPSEDERWNQMKVELDADRLSVRKLFP